MPSSDYTDDLTISNDTELWRRIPPWHFHFDYNLGRKRPSKAAFEDDEDGSPMSVVLSNIVIESGRESISALAGLEGFALAAITAGLARECEQGITRDPTDDEPAHALVFGNKTTSRRKRFAKESRWVIEPE